MGLKTQQMRKSVSAASICQFTEELVVWDRIKSLAKGGNRWSLSKLTRVIHPSLFVTGDWSLLSKAKMVTAQYSIFLKTLANSFTKGDARSKKGKVCLALMYLWVCKDITQNKMPLFGSEEAMFGITDDCKREENTSTVWFKDQETCDLNQPGDMRSKVKRTYKTLVWCTPYGGRKGTSPVPDRIYLNLRFTINCLWNSFSLIIKWG